MPYPSTPQGRPGDAAAIVPRACPACAATTIVTTAKVPRTDSYWRCLSCGEIWTPARRDHRVWR